MQRFDVTEHHHDIVKLAAETEIYYSKEENEMGMRQGNWDVDRRN